MRKLPSWIFICVIVLAGTMGFAQAIKQPMPLSDVISKAKSGNARAMAILGQYYTLDYGFKYDGVSVERDSKKARDLFSDSADEKDPVGLMWYGVSYELGIKVDKDAERAQKLYRSAMEKGLGKLAEQGDIYAQYLYGIALISGRGGVSVDAAKGIAMITAAAENGNCNAARDLAQCYETTNKYKYQFAEISVVMDRKKSLHYYKQAVKFGLNLPADKIAGMEAELAQLDAQDTQRNEDRTAKNKPAEKPLANNTSKANSPVASSKDKVVSNDSANPVSTGQLSEVKDSSKKDVGDNSVAPKPVPTTQAVIDDIDKLLQQLESYSLSGITSGPMLPLVEKAESLLKLPSDQLKSQENEISSKIEKTRDEYQGKAEKYLSQLKSAALSEGDPREALRAVSDAQTYILSIFGSLESERKVRQAANDDMMQLLNDPEKLRALTDRMASNNVKAGDAGMTYSTEQMGLRLRLQFQTLASKSLIKEIDALMLAWNDRYGQDRKELPSYTINRYSYEYYESHIQERLVGKYQSIMGDFNTKRKQLDKKIPPVVVKDVPPEEALADLRTQYGTPEYVSYFRILTRLGDAQFNMLNQLANLADITGRLDLANKARTAINDQKALIDRMASFSKDSEYWDKRYDMGKKIAAMGYSDDDITNIINIVYGGDEVLAGAKNEIRVVWDREIAKRVSQETRQNKLAMQVLEMMSKSEFISSVERDKWKDKFKELAQQ